MNSKKQIVNEITRMKNLFSYKKGRVLSEQKFSSVIKEQPRPRQRYPQGGDDVVTAEVNGAFLGYPCLHSLPGDIASTGTPDVNNVLQTSRRTLFKKFGERWRFADNGKLYSYGVEVGTFRCSGKPNTVILKYQGKEEELNLEGGDVVTAKGSDEPTGKLAQVKELPGVTVYGKIFPLTYGRTNNKIKELQIGLGMPVNLQTGGFFDRTEAAVKEKAAKLGLTYDRKTGIDKEMYNKLISRMTNPVEPVSSIDSTAKSIQADTTPTIPSNIQVPQAAEIRSSTPEQLFNSLVTSKAIDSLIDTDGVGNRRRIKYKGPEPSQEILTKVDKFLKTKGYSRIKQKVKGPGMKYVWENPNV